MCKMAKDRSTRNRKIDCDLKHNKSGYMDSTAYKAIKNINDEEKKVNKTIKLMKDIAKISGFEVMNRIELKNEKTGSEYR
ncbi:TPA: hypothetical protein KRM61_001028 [Clostridioides difficile]|uniref:hypothetical protein n=1 Tax=unclassified Clostridioides TaxID=2635829 RepID=UPI001C281CBB|nr:hypothetical protein [Clostridioides sp. ES-S-0049-03]MCC0706996.1 hypothetical protein [Clostridioides sp. ES-S-0190-01]HBH1807400.1 hypothetical protein [Clostridioides difficile]HEK4896050.1 hypothetical protein [Clostridioides difficile]